MLVKSSLNPLASKSYTCRSPVACQKADIFNGQAQFPSSFAPETHCIRVADALIAQNAFLSGTNVSYVMNVDRVRSRGVELSFQQNNVGLRGLKLSGSLTYVDAKILADSNWASASGSSVIDKRTPYVPNWRATLVATYRPNEKLASTLAARYSGKMYSTMDNTDSTSNVYGAFDSFLVLDARVHYQIDKQWSGAVGVDNLNNRAYFLFHPFPQRTLVANLKYRY